MLPAHTEVTSKPSSFLLVNMAHLRILCGQKNTWVPNKMTWFRPQAFAEQ